MQDMILLGYITKAFGLKGGLAFKLLNEDSEAIFVDAKLYIKKDRVFEQEVRVEECLDGGRVFFHEISDRNTAESLKGAEIWVAKDQLPALSSDEYYLADLLGAQVLDVSGTLLGTVSGFASNSAQILFALKTSQGQTLDIPLVKPIVLEIDYEQKIITIDPPEGLMDLADI